MHPGNNHNDHAPALVLLSGLPGTGKTTFAKALARHLPLTIVESDAVRRSLAPVPVYSPTENRRVFNAVEKRARTALRRRKLTLVDATNLTRLDRARFLALAAALQVPVIAVRTTAPRETVEGRLAKPRRGHSQADIRVYDRMRERVEPFNIPVVVVDTRFDLTPPIELLQLLLARGH